MAGGQCSVLTPVFRLLSSGFCLLGTLASVIRFSAILAILALPALLAQSDNRSTATNLEELRKKAAAGDRSAQYSLAEDYRLGLGGATPDGKEAERYYKMAAEQGMPEAQHALAVLYFEGEDIPRNYPEALRWFRAAAAQGLPESQFYICLLYTSPSPRDS